MSTTQNNHPLAGFLRNSLSIICAARQVFEVGENIEYFSDYLTRQHVYRVRDRNEKGGGENGDRRSGCF